VQKLPDRHEHSLVEAGAIFWAGIRIRLFPPKTDWQDFLLTLTDPSLQMKVPPWQCEMPPLLPLHGVFAAWEFVARISPKSTTAIWKRGMPLFTASLCYVGIPDSHEGIVRDSPICFQSLQRLCCYFCRICAG
jgi:hypothetical protein